MVTATLSESSSSKTAKKIPYKIKDMSLAEWGRKEIEIAENEMPGLMALRAKYGETKPLRGAGMVACRAIVSSARNLMGWPSCLAS